MLRLRTERTRRRWSLVRVCGLTGIAPSDLSRIERGLLVAGTTWRRRIADVFGLPEAWLFDTEPESTSAAEPTRAEEFVGA